MFFDDFSDVLRTVLLGVLSYVLLILFLRLSGKRTLSKMNAFDLVVTVALGSTLATILLSQEVSLSEGVVALGLLVGLQYSVALLSIRSQTFSSLVKSEPTLLLHKGHLLHDAMRKERVTDAEVLAAIRASGGSELHHAMSVVLETDGSMSVVPSHST